MLKKRRLGEIVDPCASWGQFLASIQFIKKFQISALLGLFFEKYEAQRSEGQKSV